MLLEHASPEEMLETTYSPGFSLFDQWQVAALRPDPAAGEGRALQRDTPDDVRRMHLEPVSDLTARVSQELENIGRDAPVRSCPRAPLPYLEQAPVWT